MFRKGLDRFEHFLCKAVHFPSTIPRLAHMITVKFTTSRTPPFASAKRATNFDVLDHFDCRGERRLASQEWTAAVSFWVGTSLDEIVVRNHEQEVCS